MTALAQGPFHVAYEARVGLAALHRQQSKHAHRRST